MTRAFKLLPELDPRAHVAEAGRWCLRTRNPIPISLGLGITPPTPILHSPRSERPGGVLYATIVPSRGRRRMLCPKWAVSNSGQVHHLPVPPHTGRALRLSTAAVLQSSATHRGRSSHIDSAIRPLARRVTCRGEISIVLPTWSGCQAAHGAGPPGDSAKT